MNNWREYKLGDVCAKIGSGATPRGGGDTYHESGEYALIRSQNVLDFEFSMQGLAYINDDQAGKLKNVEIEEKDILLNITGDSVARVCQVPSDILPARVNQHVAIIRPKKDKLNSEYLKYYLLNPEFKNYMLMLSSSGATRNAITKGMIENFIIKAPDVLIQTAIAEILSSLDDKIELNNQINKELEALAQALFKQWFIDFEFPNENGQPYKSSGGEMAESELGEIPKGWSVGKVLELFQLQRGHDLPTDSRVQGKVPVYSASGFHGYHNEAKTKAPGITTGRSGIIGNVFLILEDYWPLNTSLFVKEFKIASPYYTYFLLKEIDLLSLNGGSAVPTLNRNDVHNLNCIIPNAELINLFTTSVKDNFEMIKSKKDESEQIIQLRNELLPKLISGELEVSEPSTKIKKPYRGSNKMDSQVGIAIIKR